MQRPYIECVQIDILTSSALILQCTGPCERDSRSEPMWPQRGALLPYLVLAVLPLARGYASLNQPTYEKPVTDEELLSPITK